jgi:hypothetical protein
MLAADSAKRIGDCKLLADSDCSGILDFFMSRHRAGSLGGRVVVDAVLGAFAKKDAAVSCEVTHKVRAFHGSCH